MNGPESSLASESAARERRRRRGRLTRADVVDAVIAVGFDQATLASVAKHLSVNHATLYGHIDGRDDMVLAAAEAVFDAAQWPAAPDDDWVEALRGAGTHFWAVLSAHPGLAVVVGTAPMPPSSVTKRYGELAGLLLQCGFSAPNALAAVEMVFHHAAETAARESGVSEVGDEQWQAWEQVWVESLDELLREAMAARFATSADDRFAASLGVVLAGIAARLT